MERLPVSPGNRAILSVPYPIPRAAAYTAFLLIGLVVFWFHGHALFDLDQSGLIEYLIAMTLLVSPLAIVGCLCARRSPERLLTVVSKHHDHSGHRTPSVGYECT
jgi:hypothetical protein